MPGVSGGTFCIDLRFWYPSKSYDYEQRSTDGLRNRAGKAIPAASLRRMSYALYNHGRTSSAANQSAVMLYVHSLVGDGAPGEVDPNALAPGAGAFYGLKRARAGDVVSLTSAGGKVRRYRVTKTKLVLKAKLPPDVYSKAGPPRLVLVTCSGPFDRRTGHYRDNLVVTATPV